MKNILRKDFPPQLVGDVYDWISYDNFIRSYENRENRHIVRSQWRLNSLDFHDFIKKCSTHTMYKSEKSAYLFYDWGFVVVDNVNGQLNTHCVGPLENIEQFTKFVSEHATKTQSQIEWYYNTGRGISSTTHPLRYRKAYDSFYPQLKVPMKQFFKEYVASDACVLILIGPPGTGKTSFIENMLNETNSNAVVTYDEKVMRDDELFVSFIGERNRFMIMEDADTFIGARTDGNTIMHKFLNVSDGLIANKNKKMVFSTNLPSINSVDDALTRKGRCFDVVEFRPLTRQEAELACKDMGRELTQDGQEFLLTELFNTREMTSNARKKMGF